LLRSVRGLGMSDPPELDSRLAEKFDYINTFYHKAPRLDVTKMDERDFGRFDFIVSSEVMEHIDSPVEPAFAAMGRMLKPDGVLLLTTPFGFGGPTREHFPELHEYSIAAPGGHLVLVNRRRDGTVEVHDNLVFHGGPGSTLELRLFTQEDLRSLLLGAGFDSVDFVAETFPEFGVSYIGNWSLPIVARKGHFVPPVGDIVLQYRDARRGHPELRREYERFVAFHEAHEKEMKIELEERTAWARKIEREFEERTRWAKALEGEYNETLTEFERVKKSELEAWERVEALTRELERTRKRKWWMRGQ